MLVVKHYFLDDMERFEKEKVVLESNRELTEEEVFKLDDQELIELYNQCVKEPSVDNV